MSTFVVVNTYTHSVTYVTDKMLNSIKNIIRLSGLSPAKLTSEWVVLERGIKRWLETEYLQEIHLEVYNPATNALIGRWDFEIFYGFVGDGAFWVDTEAIKYHIRKAGVWASTCEYRIVATTKPGRPDVAGWGPATLRSTDGFVKQSIGTTIDGSGLSTGTNYWRKVS
jgi:Bacterial HORMA domain 2